ncbi:hypothetical protein ILUMI_24353 [Ignelater luminosus]|uniref:Uncharacterized protein n=1 Tax=Ignelater luminosus TaxID=2038154 RepID=A0A8K0CCN8_IGNLU|nr:hypothetical protein ILUMI_24353 [Ignelater luminosus]
MAEKVVNISKQILRKSIKDGTDYRERLMEYNSTPLVNLNASLVQTLQSRRIRTTLPSAFKKLKPKIQKHVYQSLCEQKKIQNNHSDKVTRRSPLQYKKGDEVVTRSFQIWCTAVIVSKSSRSYWVRKYSNNKVFRRNISQIKPSRAKPNHNDLTIQPELMPETLYESDQKTQS